MKPERWRQIEHLYYAALEHAPAERAAFLAEACAGDENLHCEVASFIAAGDRIGSFLEAPEDESAKTMAAAPQQSIVGQLLGHYRIVSLLGKGGMGEVYLGEDSKLGRQVALKLLPAAFTVDQSRLRRFEQEARAASALNHPNIITIHETNQTNGRHYLVTEYVAGETLRQRLTAGRMELRETVEIAVQVASALAAAHAAGIVHRDIKPENVMVRPDGLVKVLDFGLAKLIGPQAPFVDAQASTPAGASTEMGMVMGTISYMSPEQARGLKVDQRTDIFSLGVMMYEMVAGRRPFEGATGSDVIVEILGSDPYPVSQLKPGSPPELERMLNRMLAKDREARYQSAAELRAELQRLQRNVAAAAQEATDPIAEDKAAVKTKREEAAVVTDREQIGRRSFTRRSWQAVAICLGALMLAVFVYVKFLRGAPIPPSSEIKSLAVLPFRSLAPATPAAKDDYLDFGLANEIITKVSQVSGLTVRPTSAVRKYVALDVDAIGAAKELRVDAVLDGYYQQVNGRLHVSVNLLRVADGQSLFAQSFDLRVADVFALQDEVSHRVAQHLRQTLSATEQERLAKRYTSNPEAYEYYVKGKDGLDKWNVSRAELESAIGKFKRAIELDPQYALALTQLAYCYARIAILYEWNPFWFEQAKQTLSQADRLDPNLAESHVVRAFLYWSIYQNYQIDEALRELRLARRLDPNAGLTLLGDIGLHLGFEEETWRVLRRAGEIDPSSVLIQAEIAEAYAWFGKWDEALAAYDRVLTIEPNYQQPNYHGALCLLHKNQFDEAQRRLEKAQAQNPRNTVPMSYRALLLALGGEFQKAEAEIPALIEQGEKLRSYHHVTYSFACIYALQGKTEPALKWLKKTGETGMLNYPMFARDPYLERVRKAPAFIRFMTEIKERWEGYRREFG